MSFPEEYAQSKVVPVWSHVMATTVCLSFSCIRYPFDCACRVEKHRKEGERDNIILCYATAENSRI